MKPEPEGRTRLRPGKYRLYCAGPTGVIMDLCIELATRTTFELALDDEMLAELLLVTSLGCGVVEGELHKAQRPDRLKAELRTRNGGPEL